MFCAIRIWSDLIKSPFSFCSFSRPFTYNVMHKTCESAGLNKINLTQIQMRIYIICVKWMLFLSETVFGVNQLCIWLAHAEGSRERERRPAETYSFNYSLWRWHGLMVEVDGARKHKMENELICSFLFAVHTEFLGLLWAAYNMETDGKCRSI